MKVDVDKLLQMGVEQRASDLHLLVPSPPVFRIDGTLHRVDDHPPLTPEATQEALESITSESQRQAFHRDLELDFAYSIPGLARFRVNASLQRGTISLAFRCVPIELPNIDKLELPQICKTLALKQRGLILVTGRAGTGKSTTMAAMIEYLNERQTKKVITIEDPIEFLYRNKKCLIAQRDLGDDTRSFASALEHALRQDPDVILVGEMRDLETIATAITAAETGHLVLSTLHTMGAGPSIDRIIDIFPSHQQRQIRLQLTLVIEGVLSQILVPRASGKGRIAAFEVMLGTPAIRNLIREEKVFQIPNFMRLGKSEGMHTLDQHLFALVKEGVVTADEALVRAHDPIELEKMLKLS